MRAPLAPGTVFSTVLTVNTRNGVESVTRGGVIVSPHPSISDFYRVEYTGVSVAYGRWGWLYRADMSV